MYKCGMPTTDPPSTESTPAPTRGLVSATAYFRGLGVTRETGWRWRRLGLVESKNLFGRIYLTTESVAEFERRIRAGEFANIRKPGEVSH